MHMQVSRSSSAPIGGGKKRVFRDWTNTEHKRKEVAFQHGSRAIRWFTVFKEGQSKNISEGEARSCLTRFKDLVIICKRIKNDLDPG